MSICRFSRDSDVYMYEDIEGGIVCCGCKIKTSVFPRFYSSADAIAHLDLHIKSGHKVPDYAFASLEDYLLEESDA